MLVIIAGGRDYQFSESDYGLLDALHSEHGFTCVITGGSRGADAGAKEWARTRRVLQVVCHANWRRLGKGAGPVRNQQMIDHVLDFSMDRLLIAFPGGKDTADIIRRAKIAGFQVVLLSSDD